MTTAGNRIRYLAAMGIEVWSRRALAPAVPAADADDGAAASEQMRPAVQSRAAAPSPAAGGDAAADGAEAMRRVLEPSTPASASRAPVAEPAAAKAPATVPAQAPAAEIGPPPEFRLRVLVLGAGLLIVDEQAVAEGGRDRLQRLGDLLRAACLLRGGPAGGRIESQTFFWPQVDGEGVDQSLPRAVEALGAFVRRRADTAGGCLLVVDTAPGLVGIDAREPLAALDALPIARARIGADFLGAATADTDRAAWAALCRMGGLA
ncbi:MAG TPA: hypothetical protein VLA56_16705 [Pseudomonadales bacterium]|nr:hypothetical protein [Pseudomonadales bacterium]